MTEQLRGVSTFCTVYLVTKQLLESLALLFSLLRRERGEGERERVTETDREREREWKRRERLVEKRRDK